VDQAVESALAGDLPIRLHTREGEVLMARVLAREGDRLRCLVIRSSQPERYAVCDSTGLDLELGEIERAAVVSEAQLKRRLGRAGR
jgi:hypothetical protein